jgi:hypothetical protein
MCQGMRSLRLILERGNKKSSDSESRIARKNRRTLLRMRDWYSPLRKGCRVAKKRTDHDQTIHVLTGLQIFC